MSTNPVKERILAIALCLATVTGTLALFGSVPLLAEITQPRSPYSTGEIQPAPTRQDS